jgi:hypothetical protein
VYVILKVGRDRISSWTKKYKLDMRGIFISNEKTSNIKILLASLEAIDNRPKLLEK